MVPSIEKRARKTRHQAKRSDKGWQSREGGGGGERGEPLDEECNVYGGRRVFGGWGREAPSVGTRLATGIWLASGIRCLPSVDSCQPSAAPIFSTAGTQLDSKSLLLATEMHSSFRYGPRAIPLP